MARDEDFWFNVRHAFTVDRNMINLNNGGVSPAPKVVMDTEIRYLEIENLSPSYYMWNVLDPGVETVRRRLARTFGCDTEEVAITRNASEALETVQLGMTLKPGDEVLTTNQDYGRMITTWKQRERREGIKLKQITFPVPPPSLEFLAKRIEENITSQTKVIPISATSPTSPGRSSPSRPSVKWLAPAESKPSSMAHTLLPNSRSPHQDLDCDYYGTSLHKWVLAPIGTGMLYVRKEKNPQYLAPDGCPRLHAGKYPQIRGDWNASCLAAQRRYPKP